MAFRPIYKVVLDAISHFNNDDGWAMSSHVALTTIMAIFPFLIFAAALAGFLGADAFADYAVPIIFDTWPADIAQPIATEVVNVLGSQRGDLLGIGVLLALFFASNGVEALRTSLNRAYRQIESRSLVMLRLQSFGFVILATVTLTIVNALLVFAAPFSARILGDYFPPLAESLPSTDWWRLPIAAFVLLVALLVSHLFLPDGRRRIADVVPGVALTIVFWIIGSSLFVAYLDRFGNYSRTYGTLASIVVALVFLYMTAAIFILGGELNAAIMRYRALKAARPAGLAPRIRPSGT